MLGLKEFEELKKRYGCSYAAISVVVKEARRLAKKYNYIILDSEAISWVVTGRKPITLDKYLNVVRTRKPPEIAFIDDILSGVDDNDVCKCVRQSVKDSLEANHLIYVYTDIPDEGRQARVRILTRIIWYNLHNYR